MIPGFFYVSLCILFTVVGQLLMKWGMMRVGPGPAEKGQLPGYILGAFLEPGVFLGLACAVLAAVSWMLALAAKLPLSVAYPFMALAIVLVLALTPLCFGEIVNWKQWLGVAVVAFGLWVGVQ